MKRGESSSSIGIVYPLYRHFVDRIARKIYTCGLVQPVRLEGVYYAIGWKMPLMQVTNVPGRDGTI